MKPTPKPKARGHRTRPAPALFGAAKDTILYLAPDEELLATGAEWAALADDRLSPP